MPQKYRRKFSNQEALKSFWESLKDQHWPFKVEKYLYIKSLLNPNRFRSNIILSRVKRPIWRKYRTHLFCLFLVYCLGIFSSNDLSVRSIHSSRLRWMWLLSEPTWWWTPRLGEWLIFWLARLHLPMSTLTHPKK